MYKAELGQKALSNYAARRNVIIFIFGIFVGFSFAFLFVTSELRFNLLNGQNSSEEVDLLLDVGKHNETRAFENRTVDQELFDDVKILCWIMTNSSNHKTKAIHVLKTWGKRCNKLLFMSSATDEELNSIALPVKEGRDNLWAKTKASFKYIHDHHLNDYDWFLKADDDTYVVVENLRFMLYPYAAETPIYFGCKFKPYVKQGYMSGGAGYVLSREAVRRFVEIAIPDKEKCRQSDCGNEDVEMGKCLENVDVIAGDSRDWTGRERFIPLFLDNLQRVHRKKDSWYWKYLYHQVEYEELLPCSNYAISFHYVTPTMMNNFEYLIYYLRVYGIASYPQPFPHKQTTDGYRFIEFSTSSTLN